jgi:hypothetical protein
MVLSILESGLKTKFMAEANILGTMAENMRATGRIIIWMDSVYILGRMEECMKATIRKIKSMAKEFILGLTEDAMMGNGKMEDNMALESTYLNKDSIEREFGKMEREKDGLMKIIEVFNYFIEKLILLLKLHFN